MPAPDDVYQQILKERWQDGVYREVKQVAVSPELYRSAYEFMHRFSLQREVVSDAYYPLPVPSNGYRLFGVTVLCVLL